MAALRRLLPSSACSCSSCSYSQPVRTRPLPIAIAVAKALPSLHLSLLASSRSSPSPLSSSSASSSYSFSSTTRQGQELPPQPHQHCPPDHIPDPLPLPQTHHNAWSRTRTEDDEWFLREQEIHEPTLADDRDALSLAQDDAWYRTQAEDGEWFRKEEEFYETRLAERAPPQARPQVDPDYLSLSDSALFAQCRMDTFRASGPGGQHRNKTDSGVRLKHIPTNLVAQAVDDRSQHKNRATAMSRLRLLIAAKVRRPVKLHGYEPPLELKRLLPAEGGKKSTAERIGINHPDYAKGVQSLLDLLSAVNGFVFFAAEILRVSPGAFSKILTADKIILQSTNELLVSKGQKPFK